MLEPTTLATSLLLALGSAPAPAAPSVGPLPVAGGLRAAVADELPRAIELRRDFHAHPELGEREHRTAGVIAARLRELGLEVEEGVASTGVVGVLRGGRPGGVAMYRADMDALPVREATGLPFASRATDEWGGQEVGVMHACGHDLHMAIALGVAGVLARPDQRAALPGSVVFLFQPAEEGLPLERSYGAKRVVEEGVLERFGPTAAFGLHVDPSLEVGQAVCDPGGVMAAVDRFRIVVTGRQAHGAYPHEGVDPIVVASQLVLALQTIPSRVVDPRDPVVVTVGKLAAGNRYNIIPPEAELVGTIRTHDDGVQARVHERVRALAEGICEPNGASAEVEIRTLTPVTVNDAELVARMRPVVERVVGAEGLRTARPHMGGEDFAYYGRVIPSLMYFLGVSDFSKGRPASIHQAEFDPEEGAIAVGIEVSASLLVAYLGGLAD